MELNDIDVQATPTSTGCRECLQEGTWWMHLRRCARCGHIGCCDSSPRQHATRHFELTGHRLMQSFEPREQWFWDYHAHQTVQLDVALAPPTSRPTAQPAPGPLSALPLGWENVVPHDDFALLAAVDSDIRAQLRRAAASRPPDPLDEHDATAAFAAADLETYVVELQNLAAASEALEQPHPEADPAA